MAEHAMKISPKLQILQLSGRERRGDGSRSVDADFREILRAAREYQETRSGNSKLPPKPFDQPEELIASG